MKNFVHFASSSSLVLLLLLLNRGTLVAVAVVLAMVFLFCSQLFCLSISLCPCILLHKEASNVKQPYIKKLLRRNICVYIRYACMWNVSSAYFSNLNFKSLLPFFVRSLFLPNCLAVFHLVWDCVSRCACVLAPADVSHLQLSYSFSDFVSQIYFSFANHIPSFLCCVCYLFLTLQMCGAQRNQPNLYSAHSHTH